MIADIGIATLESIAAAVTNSTFVNYQCPACPTVIIGKEQSQQHTQNLSQTQHTPPAKLSKAQTVGKRIGQALSNDVTYRQILIGDSFLNYIKASDLTDKGDLLISQIGGLSLVDVPEVLEAAELGRESLKGLTDLTDFVMHLGANDILSDSVGNVARAVSAIISSLEKYAPQVVLKVILPPIVPKIDAQEVDQLFAAIGDRIPCYIGFAPDSNLVSKGKLHLKTEANTVFASHLAECIDGTAPLFTRKSRSRKSSTVLQPLSPGNAHAPRGNPRGARANSSQPGARGRQPADIASGQRGRRGAAAGNARGRGRGQLREPMPPQAHATLPMGPLPQQQHTQVPAQSPGWYGSNVSMVPPGSYYPHPQPAPPSQPFVPAPTPVGPWSGGGAWHWQPTQQQAPGHMGASAGIVSDPFEERVMDVIKRNFGR